MTLLKLKRAYKPQAADDGFRVYVDRLWPRGQQEPTFSSELWDKEISPSTELREWFHADQANRWSEFGKRYLSELRSSAAFQSLAEELKKHPVVTLLYSSHDEAHNNADVLRQALLELPGFSE